jgi:hypothetical protein
MNQNKQEQWEIEFDEKAMTDWDISTSDQKNVKQFISQTRQ